MAPLALASLCGAVIASVAIGIVIVRVAASRDDGAEAERAETPGDEPHEMITLALRTANVEWHLGGVVVLELRGTSHVVRCDLAADDARRLAASIADGAKRASRAGREALN